MRNFETTLFLDKHVLDLIPTEMHEIMTIDHPNIVPFREMINEPPFIRLKRKYIPGTSLSKIVYANGPLEKRTGLKIGLKVMQSVSYLHSRNIVVKALKPENIILSPQMEPILVDFGISAILEDTVKRPDNISSFIYLGPERLENPQLPPTQKLDIFHFGLFLYLIFIGKLPWRVINLARIMKDLNSKSIPLPQDFDRDVRSIILHCMDPNPDERPSSDKIIHVIHKVLMKKETNATSSQSQLPIHQSASLKSMGKTIAMRPVSTFESKELTLTTCPLPPKQGGLPMTKSFFMPMPAVKTLPVRTRQITKTESQSSFSELQHTDEEK